ncbi:MAG: phosphoglycerate kinase, partial [Deltaproteobacteria bacterium]
FNVPLDEFRNITDERRIRSAIPTIRYCLDRGCAVILASHLGRPKGRDEDLSLLPVAKRLNRILAPQVQFAENITGKDAVEKASVLKSGEVLLLENLRFDERETKNNETFAKELADLADIFINDAFGVCHRAHASVEAITRFFDDDKKAAGFLLQKEIQFSQNLLKRPQRPFIAVVGGSKVSGKLQALHSLLPRVDKLIIGGGMAFTFLKAQGFNVGNSLVEDELIKEADTIMKEARHLGVKLYLPVDFVVSPAINNESPIKFVTSQEIPSDWMGLDIGPATSRLFSEAIADGQTILWNGPMGVFEVEKFSRGSVKMSHVISQAHATTVVGGGDTADVVARAGDADEMTFMSTG